MGGVQRSLHPQYHDEVPLSEASNPQLLPEPTAPGVCSRCVHVHFGWVICRAQIQSMGHHTWPYVTSGHVMSHTHTHTGVTDRLQWRAAA